MPSWLVGSRDAAAANMFMQDLASRMRGRIQLTSDGHRPYLEAVEGAFGAEIDYAMLIKLYGHPRDDAARYSPPAGFSKKAENHAHAVALHYMHYNFGRIHKTLRVTPAMECGVADQVWTMDEIAALVDANYVPKPRGPYKKKVQPANSN